MMEKTGELAVETAILHNAVLRYLRTRLGPLPLGLDDTIALRVTETVDAFCETVETVSKAKP